MPSDEKYTFSYLAPIPTYEEATSSRSASPNSRRGAQEISDDAERQGLLNNTTADSHSNYAPPTVESARDSLDSLDGLNVDEDQEVRREMQEMDIEEPSSSRTSLLSNRFSKFTSSLPSFPSIRRFIPKLRWPNLDWQAMDANRIVILGRLFGVLILGLLIYALFAADVLTLGRNRNPYMFRPDAVRQFLMDSIGESDMISLYLQKITQYPHIAGTEGNYVLGEWIEELFKASKLENVQLERFDVYLNYPRKDGRRVAIVSPEDAVWEAKLEEDNEDTYVFHGHSASGDVTGALVYANFCAREDFDYLKSVNVVVQDSIILCRYYGTETDRALKVKAAELAGARGVVIYSDPAQDGAMLGPKFPEGRYMPPDGVQRGAVSLMSWVVGDVLSPGFASTPSERKRLSVSESAGLNRIPSLPLSWRDAQHLLSSLVDHGTKLSGNWTGDSNTEYWTGDTSSPQINLKNEQDEETRQPIYNVLGRIQGWETTTSRVVIGSHRDAWCTGAADPGSGTAIMLELVRVFGQLQAQGWRPIRSIEFASWDGEEYNLIGSTEHVESRIDELKEQGVAYINLDTAVTGTKLHIAGSPLLTHSVHAALKRVNDPNTNEPLLSTMTTDNDKLVLAGLGAGSDYVGFQCIAGVSSLDLSFQGTPFPYHSCYDNYEWMSHYGDPDGFKYSKTLAKLISLIILDLSDHALLPLDLDSYHTQLQTYIETLDHDISSSNPPSRIPTQPLRDALSQLPEHVTAYAQFDTAWHAELMAQSGFEQVTMQKTRHQRNERLRKFEKHLLSDAGIVNRTQFKHVVFGPQRWSGYDEAFFPGIRDFLEEQDWEGVRSEIDLVAERIKGAVESLAGQ